MVLWPEVCGGQVVSVSWSPSRPACFMALDASCKLHWFDLTQVGLACCVCVRDCVCACMWMGREGWTFMNYDTCMLHNGM